MKVKLSISISGTRDGADWPPAGAVVDLPDPEAADLVSAGLAVEVAEPKVEKAVQRRKVEKRA